MYPACGRTEEKSRIVKLKALLITTEPRLRLSESGLLECERAAKVESERMQGMVILRTRRSRAGGERGDQGL
jgi:hypothetical protein